MVKFSLEERGSVDEGESSTRRSKRMRYFSDDEDCIDEYAEGVDEAVENVSTAAAKQASPISFILTDPEVLDCAICYESLTLPVFQCGNGHIACSSCCTKLKNKCPFCSFPIGYNRCRAIEKVIESVKVLCQNSRYGCDERLSLGVRKDHEVKCIHMPVTCPIHECNFLGSCHQLWQHCSARHSDSVQRFQYSSSCTVLLDGERKIKILQEETDGALFVVINNPEVNGNALVVKCIGPISSNRVFMYNLVVRKDNNTLSLKTNMENHSAVTGTSSSFLFVPVAFLRNNGLLTIKLSIEPLLVR